MSLYPDKLHENPTGSESPMTVETTFIEDPEHPGSRPLGTRHCDLFGRLGPESELSTPLTPGFSMSSNQILYLYLDLVFIIGKLL